MTSRKQRGSLALQRTEIPPDGGNDRRSVLDDFSGWEHDSLCQSGFREDLGTTLAELYANPHPLAGGDPSRGRREGEESAFEGLPRGGAFNVDYRITRPDGTVVWISDRGYVQRDDRDQVVNLSGVATDITWRKQAEQALSDREAQHRAVIETTPDGFYVTDHDGRFLEVNDAYLRISGYTLEELRKMRITDVEANENADRDGVAHGPDPAEAAATSSSHCIELVTAGLAGGSECVLLARWRR